MRIATFNCNSVRKRLDLILAWLADNQPDVLALQETKVMDDDFPAAALAEAGWHAVYRGQKSYNGVAMLSRMRPQLVSFGLQDGDDGESEPRLVRIRYGGIDIINTYVPQGRALETEQFQFKLAWLKRLRAYFERELGEAAATDAVWVGDLNVAPEAKDVHDSKKIWPHVCHCQEVIDRFQEVLDWGWGDVFRRFLPEAGVYTFWDYRVRGAIDRGLGWRIDHVLGTPSMAERAKGCRVDMQARRSEAPSDHTFVISDWATD